MQEMALILIDGISLFFLGIFRYVSTRIGLALVEDVQPPTSAAFIRYRQYIQFTSEWIDEHWPILTGWARSFLDCLLPNDGDVEGLADHGSQPGPTNPNPFPTAATVVPHPPPPAYHGN